MKNHRITISFAVLGIMLATMVFFVFTSKAAQDHNLKNPYDTEDKSYSDIIDDYHNNMNDAFNRYIKLMMTNLQKNPEDPNGKAFHMKPDGTVGDPFTTSDCLDPSNANNYSTFCVAVNLLGGNSDECDSVPLAQQPDDLQKFCQLGGSAQALKGYLNFVAAVNKKTQTIFDTKDSSLSYSDYLGTVMGLGASNPATCKMNSTCGPVYQVEKSIEISTKVNKINNEISVAKKTLDQTLSAYDQLKMAWPIHLKYVDIYKDLETYRDKLVDVRHQTDNFPKKFIDLTTTSCI